MVPRIVCSRIMLGVFSRYVLSIYTSVVEVWCVGGILCTTLVACSSFSYIGSHCMPRTAAPCSVLVKQDSDNTASVEEGSEGHC